MIAPAEAGTLGVNGNLPAGRRGLDKAAPTALPASSKARSGGEAGLKDNDVITAVDGQALNINNPLVSVIPGPQAG